MRTLILPDDEITIRRDAGDESIVEKEFVWRNFQLFDESGRQLDLDTDIFIEN